VNFQLFSTTFSWCLCFRVGLARENKIEQQAKCFFCRVALKRVTLPCLSFIKVFLHDTRSSFSSFPCPFWCLTLCLLLGGRGGQSDSFQCHSAEKTFSFTSDFLDVILVRRMLSCQRGTSTSTLCLVVEITRGWRQSSWIAPSRRNA